MTTRFKRVLETFKLPPDIEGDIVYCQRMLRAHLKVHQMIVERFNADTDSSEVKALNLRQIEYELTEINCEQEYLLLRLKRIIDEYFKAQNRENDVTNQSMLQEHVSRTIVPLVNNKEYRCSPTSIRARATEQELIDTYIDRVRKELSPAIEMPAGPTLASVISTDQASIANSNERRVSLLKPMSERVINAIPIVIPDDDTDLPSTSEEQPSTSSMCSSSASSDVSSTSYGRCSTAGQTSKIVSKSTTSSMRSSSHLPAILRRSPPKLSQSPATTTVQSSSTTNAPIVQTTPVTNNKRQNLRNALLNAAATMKNKPPKAPQFVSQFIPQHSAELVPQYAPQAEPQVAIVAPRKSAIIASKSAKNEATKKTCSKPVKSDPSSSEDSIDGRAPSPQHIKTIPQDYSQQDFLSLFNLYTKSQIQVMQQRRSKRQRRCAHNNERDDFHYGGLDHMFSPDIGKKRKREFLSPRGNRLVRKTTANKNLSDRSGSSSPDEQSSCKECCKRSGILIQCNGCQGVYHENCHKDASLKHESYQCPPCARARNQELLQREAYVAYNTTDLRGQYRELKEQMALEQRRHEKLRRQNVNYKVNMNKLYDIVKDIKRYDD